MMSKGGRVGGHVARWACFACLLVAAPAGAQVAPGSSGDGQSELGSRLQQFETWYRKTARNQAALWDKYDKLVKRIEHGAMGTDPQLKRLLKQLLDNQRAMQTELNSLKAALPAADTAAVPRPSLSPADRSRKARLEEELDAVRAKLQSLSRAVQGGLDPELVEDSRGKLEKRERELARQLAAIEPGEPKTSATIDDLLSAVEEVKQLVTQRSPFDPASEAEANATARPAVLAEADPTEPTWLKIELLLQGWSAFTDAAAPDNASWDTDFYLRRMRILLTGQLNEKVNFFVETDSPDLAKQGNLSVTTFIQDAWVEYNFGRALQVDLGMLLVPFSHHGTQGAVTLHSVDYHGVLLKYPTGSHKVWRDFGLMVRGLVFDDRLDWRLAVLNGAQGGADDPRNPHDLPRLSGRLTLNLADAEGGPGAGGFFSDGLYLEATPEGVVSTKKIVSIGASFDWQKDLNVRLTEGSGEIDRREDYHGVAVDVFFDLPLDAKRLLGLSGQLNVYYYQHGDRRAYDDGSPRSFFETDGKYDAEYTGYGILSELGLRYDRYEVVACVDWFEATHADGDAGDYLSVYGGLNYWWFGHATSIKLQLGRTRVGGGDWRTAGVVQAQLLF